MKNLIISFACLAIIMILLLEFVQAEVVFGKIVRLENRIEALKEEIRVVDETAPDDEYLAEFRESCAEITGCEAEEVLIELSKSKSNRLEIAELKAEIPLGRVIVGAKFWGISDDVSGGKYKIDRLVVCE